MKTLEKGRQQKGWADEYRCTGAGNGKGGCNAKLLVEHGDLFRTAKHSYDGSSEYFVTFACAECGVLTDIDDAPFNPMALPTKESR